MNPAHGSKPPATQPFLRLTRKLEPGFAVTVEPGIYFIDSLLNAARANGHAAHINWERVDELRPYGGIRVEDDVVVASSGGHENLTRNAFAQLRTETAHSASEIGARELQRIVLPAGRESPAATPLRAAAPAARRPALAS